MDDSTTRSARIGLARIDTSFTLNVYDDHSPTKSLETYSSPVIPTVSAPTSFDTSRPTVSTTNSRARNEAKKLLSHVLIQLANRTKPPAFVDTIRNTARHSPERSIGALAESLKEAVKRGGRSETKSDRNTFTANEDDSDEGNEAAFTTDATIDLMLQLKDVLTMAAAQGWQIFDDSTSQDLVDEESSKSSYTFRRSRNSFKTGGKRSRSASFSKGRNQLPELLSLCISILGSVVSEDCRYQVTSPRPSRPPNSLQMLTLNVAQFLVHSHRHDPRVISDIAFAMMPAFHSFHRQMHARLLQFFEASIVRVILQSLLRLRGLLQETNTEPSNESTAAVSNDNDIPTVSIQIEEVMSPDNSLGVSGPFEPTKSVVGGQIQSTNNPRQSLHIYYLAFLIPPLIGVVLDSLQSMDDPVLDIEIYTQTAKLIHTIAASKIDAYNDLLEVVAYRNAKSRRWAIAMLSELWPKSVGHTVISRPFPFHNNSGRLPEKRHDFHLHQFVPWRFESNDEHTRTNNTLHSDCRSCLKPIHGFSLMCPSCMTSVHFDCYDYPEGNYHIRYSIESGQHTQRVAILRFSHVIESEKNFQPGLSKYGHAFRLTNWFTLCLCFVCRKPLWGCFAQGLKCERCPSTMHLHCLSSLGQSQQCSDYDTVTSENIIITPTSLRESCIQHFPFLLYPEQLYNSSYEEISIYQSILYIQLQLFNNGITFGSVIVGSNNDTAHKLGGEIDHFELHSVLEKCEQLLLESQKRLPLSVLTQQYMQDSNSNQRRPSVMFNWSYLEYITAAIKTSIPQSRQVQTATSDFLNVGQVLETSADIPEAASLPYESVTLLLIKNILQTDFALRSENAAKFILDQLHHLSFFDRMDHSTLPFEDLSAQRDLICVFPLPLGLDLSMNVETLVSSIEASLSDLDLTTNEFGFLLLTRRFWPNGLASEYGLKRLALQVLSWILDEDNNLAIILREYVAKQLKLPGVRTDRNSEVWPSLLGSRSAPTSIANNGGDFVSARRSLLSRFAVPWLLELHDLDPVFYCQTIFAACCQTLDGASVENANLTYSAVKVDKNINVRCDNVLRSAIKLSQCFVIFTVFDDLFLHWMNFVFDMGAGDQAIQSLHRLFSRDSEATQSPAATTSSDFTGASPDPHHTTPIDPLRAISILANQSETGLSRSISYLPLLIKSGIIIPASTFKHFLSLVTSNKRDSLDNAEILIRAIVLSLWDRPTSSPEIQDVIASLHSNLSSQISQCLISGENPDISLSIIRHSLVACLRVYGCEKTGIIGTGMILASEVQDLPSQRKLPTRGAMTEDPIFIHSDILTALVLYIESKVDEVTCYAAKFLYLFLTESPFLEGFEIDNFILRNGKMIASCAWATYDIQREDVAIARTGLLLRSLLIDAEPLQEILSTNMDFATSTVKERLSSVNRLFRIVLDVTSPVFHVEGRQWRSSVIEIFSWYFSALWLDPGEEVRMAVRSSSTALLPAHFDAISMCWSESLLKAPITERVRLVGFLIQLRPHFLGWKVLSWSCMIDTLVEYDYDPKNSSLTFGEKANNMENETDKYQSSTTDPDMAHLRVSIILLGLQMIADGIEIDSFELMKLKIQLVQIAGFNNVSVVPTQSQQNTHLQYSDIVEIAAAAHPCVEELAHLVDAPHLVKVPQSALGLYGNREDEKRNVLVGSVFLDVILYMLATLQRLSALPVLTLKCLLEALYIIIHKYDFNNDVKHLQDLLRKAILRSVEMLSQDISYELRQLSLSIAQAAINKCHSFLWQVTISEILETIATEIASQTRNSQDAVITHGKLLIGNTLQMFYNTGLLLTLFRRPLQPPLFTVLNQILHDQGREASSANGTSLCDLLIRDTLSRSMECDRRIFPTVMQNISNFVETVYFEGYNSELLTYCGQYLNSLARRLSDGSIEGLDASPLVTIMSILIQNHKKSKEIFLYIEGVLRIALNRLHVAEASIMRLIKAVVPSKPKVHENSGATDVVNILFDILLDGFRMKTKMSPRTLKSLIKSLLMADNLMILPPSVVQRQPFRGMIDDAYSFLQNHIWSVDSIDHDFQAIVETAKLLLGAINRDPAHFQRLTEPVTDKSLRVPPTLRSWNILLLVTLQESEDDWKSMIYDHFTSFCSTYSAVLRRYVLSGISSSAAATTDINQAHISLRLWLMLAHSISTSTHNGESVVVGIWNEMWPAYESFLNVLDLEARVGLYPALVSLAAASVADLIVYLRSLKTCTSLDTSAYLVILDRLRALGPGDSTAHKISRTLRILSEPPAQVSDNILLDQVAKELVAAEKIRIIDSR